MSKKNNKRIEWRALEHEGAYSPHPARIDYQTLFFPKRIRDQDFRKLAQYCAQRICNSSPILDYHEQTIVDALEATAEAVILGIKQVFSKEYLEDYAAYQNNKSEIDIFVKTEVIHTAFALLSFYFESKGKIPALNKKIKRALETCNTYPWSTENINLGIKHSLQQGLRAGFMYLGLDKKLVRHGEPKFSENANRNVIRIGSFPLEPADTIEDYLYEGIDSLKNPEKSKFVSGLSGFTLSKRHTLSKKEILSAFRQGLIIFRRETLPSNQVDYRSFPDEYQAVYLQHQTKERDVLRSGINPHTIASIPKNYRIIFGGYFMSGDTTYLEKEYENAFKITDHPRLRRASIYMYGTALNLLGIDTRILRQGTLRQNQRSLQL